MNIKNLGLAIDGVAEIFTDEESKGCVRIVPYTFNLSENILYNLRAVRDGGSLFQMYDGDYVKLIVDGVLMMSDTAMERISNNDIVKYAKGDVMVAGLGLGVILRNLLENDLVESVLVVEKYQDVIDLVEPKYRHPKLKVVCSDIHNYVPEQKFDTIYLDIWPDITTENLEEIEKLESQFKDYLNEDGYLDSWMKKLLLVKRGVEEGTHCEDCECELDYCECELCEECGEKMVFGECEYCDEYDDEY